jgi:hypothetical protein
VADERDLRAEKLVCGLVDEYALDLDGLTVLTEAASGPYLHTPLLPALAGARVLALTGDSSYASAADVQRTTLAVAEALGVSDRLEISVDRAQELVGRADIVTNSGFVRPIDRAMVSWLKESAVVSLMWETWEFRPDELDLDACRERGILVLGTDESQKPLALYPYLGFAALKLLFDIGLEGYKTKVVLLGGGRSFGKAIRDRLLQFGVDLAWFAENESAARPYDELPSFFEAEGALYDAVLVAEHVIDRPLIGTDALLATGAIRRINPALRIGVMAGNVSAADLDAEGIFYRPQALRPFGYMSYQPAALGPRPVLELYAAGLKVGEAMARARLSGMDLEEAKRHALEQSPALDFPGEVRE